MKLFDVEVELTEHLLGTVAKDDEVYASFIRSKAPVENPEEIPPEEEEERGWTGFYRDADGRPVLMDYQIKGFLKEAADILNGTDPFRIKGRVTKTTPDPGMKRITAIKSVIDNTVFVFPRRIVLGDDVDGVIERPLRAMTMRGPRVSLARSDYIKEGTTFSFQIKTLPVCPFEEEHIRAMLDYGELKGLGQWRNGGYGRFVSRLTVQG